MMFPVLFASMICTLISLTILVMGIWDHDLTVVRLSALALFGWVVALCLAIYVELKK